MTQRKGKNIGEEAGTSTSTPQAEEGVRARNSKYEACLRPDKDSKPATDERHNPGVTPTPDPLVSRKVEQCATVSRATCVQRGTPDAEDRATSQLFCHPAHAKSPKSSRSADSRTQVQLPIAESSLSTLSVQTCAETPSNPALLTSGADVTIPNTAYAPSAPTTQTHLPAFNSTPHPKHEKACAYPLPDSGIPSSGYEGLQT